MSYENELVHENICPICGKPFAIRGWQDWQWKIGINKQKAKNVCSYTCMRKWENEYFSQRKENTKKKEWLKWA